MRKSGFLLLVLTFIVGCGLEEMAVPTLTPTTADTPTSTSAPTATNTPTPTITPSPTSTSTPSPTPLPLVSVIAEEVKLRNGPGVDYPVIGIAVNGDELSLQGRDEESLWLYVETSDGITAWVPVGEVDYPEDLNTILEVVTWSKEPPPIINGWSGDPVDTVCLELAMEHIGMYQVQKPEFAVLGPGDSDYDYVYNETLAYLTELGLTPVDPGEDCAATMAVDLTINMYGQSYVGMSSGQTFYCYDGASVSGTVQLTSPAGDMLSASSSQSRPGEFPDIRDNCYGYSRFLGESYYVILQGMRRFWGNEVLLFGLDSNQIDIQKYAVRDIGYLGAQGMPFVPELIGCLSDSMCSSAVEQSLISALVSITGQNFGDDAALWQDWWDAQEP
ncbi:MAG: SH3 domain-containing protein [Anaerolineae bacterium]|nr:SH3 domain-containing protein [Anaerolineae bacterium]